MDKFEPDFKKAYCIANDVLICSHTIETMPGYKIGQPIRLLSCNTGLSSASFAQNLANKLNVSVWAPNKYLWADNYGRHFVAGKKSNGEPDYSDKGSFIEFKPGGKKNG